MTERQLKLFYQLRTLDPTDYAVDSTATIDFDYDYDINKQYDLLQKLINSKGTATESRLSRVSQTGQKLDDIEPLGFNDSIVEELLENDIIDDSRDPLKEKYFISSENFDARLYVDLHQQRSPRELYSKLAGLEDQINLRQSALNDVLHKEFLKFITIKNLLGDTMERYDKEKDFKSFEKLGTYLKQTSDESDNILGNLVEAKNKGLMLKSLLNFVNENKFLFNLPQNLSNDIRLKDYDSLIYDYNKGKQQYLQILESVEQKQILESNVALLNRVWIELENVVNDYKKLTWDKLNIINIDNLNTSSYNISININNDQNYIALIYKLLELDAEDNPIIEFINIQYSKISTEIEEMFANYMKNINLMKNRILNTYTLESFSPISFLIRLARDNTGSNGSNNNNGTGNGNGNGSNPNYSNEHILDLPLVQELWNLIQQFIEHFTGMISKVIKFSSIVDFVINGNLMKQHTEYKLKKNSSEFQDSHNIERHLKFESYEVKKMNEQNEKLILKICNDLISFFVTKKNDSTLSTPLSLTLTKTPLQYSTEDYSFLPPLTNSITTSINNILLYKKISNNFQNFLDSKTSISTNSTVVELLKTTCVKINQSLQMSMLTLLIEDMKYCYLLDLDDVSGGNGSDGSIESVTGSHSITGASSDLNLTDLIELYYSLFIRKASNSIYQQEITNNFKIYPSKKLLSNCDTLLLKSLKFFIESNLKKNLISEDDENTKYKALTNFYDLKKNLSSNVLSRYDQFFKSSLSQQHLEIYGILDNLTVEIFESLINPLTIEITSYFNRDIKYLQISNPKRLSKTIREVILVLILTRVRTLNLKLPEHLTFNIITRLIQHTLLKIQDLVKLNNESLEQFIVDLKYFENYFQDFITRDQDSIKMVDKIYGILSNKCDMRKLTARLDPIVQEALNDSKMELE